MSPRPLGLAALLFAAACASSAPREEAPAPVGSAVVSPAPAGEPTLAIQPVAVELWAMSQCPYAASFEETLSGVVASLGPSVTLKVGFIGEVESGELVSMHGPDEVTGDLAQICAQKHSSRWLELIRCQNQDPDQVATSWEGCALKLGMPVDAIARCLNGDEGKALLTASFEDAKRRKITGSPTLLIAHKKYAGPRQAESVTRAICDAYPAEKAPLCAAIPPAPEVKVTLLEDARCSECRQDLDESLRSRIDNPVITRLDYGTPSGRALYEAIGGGSLPAFVFDASLVKDPAAAYTFRKGRTVADRHVVESGQFEPRCADPGGCDLDPCKPMLSCRKETPKKVELFTMSKCPFCAEAIQALPEVLDNFKKAGASVDLSIHFIGSVDDSGKLDSMRGEPEVAEDLRQACAIEHYPKGRKYLDYLVCRAKTYKSDDWRVCTGKKLGIDADVLSKCAEGKQGVELLEASFTYSKRSGVRASPTFLINDQHKRNARYAEPIKKLICEHNKLAGCDKQLSEPPPKTLPAP